MLFSLKFHRDNRQNALALYSAKRKNEEKRLYFHRAIEMKQPHTMTEPNEFKRLCHSTWLFCLGNMLKNICFFSNFLLAGSMTGEFYWLSIWNFKR